MTSTIDRQPESRPSAPSTDRPSLVGQVALITGGGSGLGAATAMVLAAAGLRVAVGDIAMPGAERTVASVEEAGGEALAIDLDVTGEASAAAAVSAILDRWGRLDVLVNNAGVDRTAPFEELTGEDWDRVIGVNLRGPVVMTAAVLPGMRAAGRGHIVNITSTAAKRAWENASAYHATKWGLLGLSHALHAEARQYGVKVSAVVCGGMRTPFLLERFPDLDPGLLQDPHNVAEAIRFVIDQPNETVIPEILVMPMRETSWP